MRYYMLKQEERVRLSLNGRQLSAGACCTAKALLLSCIVGQSGLLVLSYVQSDFPPARAVHALLVILRPRSFSLSIYAE
jgi:hypothetical protein